MARKTSNGGSWLRASVPSRSRKKVRKLIRDPNRFFYDLFGKRLGIVDGVEDLDLLPRDFITPHEEAYRTALAALRSKTCQVQEMSGPYPHIRRLAVKNTDLGYAIDVILGESYKGMKPVVQRPENPRGLTRIWFTDGRCELRNPTIELDPWRQSEFVVQTDNFHPFCSAVSIRDIHKTVHSPAPLSLGGDSSTSETFEEALGFTSSFLHHFPWPVDVVYTWVDDTDPAWRERKDRFLRQDDANYHPAAVSDARYRNREELRYSLRSIASFFKGVRHIYIATDAQTPAWLDTNHAQIKLVDHRDFFASSEHLPSFNSHAIEANLHNIDGLSEHFVYFNDDVMLGAPCTPLDFFHPNGIGKSFFEPLCHVQGMPSTENPAFKNAAQRGARLLFERFGRLATTYHEHVAHALKRSVLEKMAEDFPAELRQTSAARFRGENDLSPVSFFYHYYALQHGLSVPASISSVYVPLGRRGSGSLLRQFPQREDVKVICLNDLPESDSKTDAEVASFFQRMFPAPAPWELDR